MIPRVLSFLLGFALLTSSATARTWVVSNGSPGAADSNPGTEDKPLRTIDAAARQAQPGDTVLVHAGTYRERVTPARGGAKDQPVIYTAAPGEAVAVKGSDLWTHWQPVPGHPGVYSAEIAGHIPSGQPNPFAIGISIAPDDANIVARPADAKADLPKTLGQVFFDGAPVVETVSESTVLKQENSWVSSADGTRLLAHFPGRPADLSTHRVEVSVRNRIFCPRRRGLEFIHVKGFVFEHCANQGPFPQGGAVSPRAGSYWLIEGNTIRFAKTVGLDVGSESFTPKNLKDTDDDQKVRLEGGHHVVENNIISDNGLAGISGWHHNGVVIRNNVIERNNALGFNQTDAKWEEWGGIKLHGAGAWIEGNLVRDNEACGIWIDNDYTDSRITRNVVLGNRMAGIFLELGDGHCLIDNNIVALTRPRDAMYAGCGVYAHDSSGLVIAHNLVLSNADCGVLLRTVSDRVFKNVPVHTNRSRVLNNILWNNSKAAISLPYPNERAADNLSDYNVVYGGRDLWLGFESDPGCFAVNLYKSSVNMDSLEANLKAVLQKNNVPAAEQPNFKFWRRNPTLTLGLWRLFMGQDVHSKESPNLVTLLLRAQVPMLTYQASPPVLGMKCPPVEGVDRDFFGEKLDASRILPGPFQNLKESPAEAVLFPVRFP